MTRSELVEALATRFPQLIACDAEMAVDHILGVIGQTLARGHRVEIRGFGSFSLNYRPPRMGAKSEDRREGVSAREIQPALQGREGIEGRAEGAMPLAH